MISIPRYKVIFHVLTTLSAGLIWLAVSACSTLLNLTPEQAASQELIQFDNAIPNSIRIHQTQSWGRNRVVLASYLSSQNNAQMSCEAVFEMQPSAMGWRISGSGMGCSSPPNTDPVTSGSGTQGIAPDDLSYAHGLVILLAAQTVEITWQDGVVQRVPVVNGSFLALRDGSIQMIARVEVLDSAETVIHEIEIMPNVQKLP